HLDIKNGSRDPEVRAHEIWLIGVNGYKNGRDLLITALKDEDVLVRRYACEALIRAGMEPGVDAIWPLLGDNDRFVRTAARLVLQRIDPSKWADRIAKETKDIAAWEAIVALCKTDAAAARASSSFGRVDRDLAQLPTPALLNYLRTLQLLLVHTSERPPAIH